ncbi:MAG: formamidopyrimidine-DNA glycosylase [Acidimicrobiia bacterium]|nr:formamidopyrimidine-DNA glycosylase [Acidimicrobiia bacterium]
MPELAEVEFYRRAAEAVVGRRIGEVDVPDAGVGGALGPAELTATLVGCRVVGAERRGKLLVLRTDGADLGLRFGMTGRLVVDGEGPIGELLWSPSGDDERWRRFTVRFGHGELSLVDPRRFGSVELDPDLACLGPDALDLPTVDLAAALARSTTPLKARLLDQRRIAGIGNLAADEMLWDARMDPRRQAGALGEAALERLGDSVRRVGRELLDGGGSHTGPLRPHRRPGGCCPRCGDALRRDTVGGRTTWWCEGCATE